MSVIKLVEDYAINYARTQVRDALMYHGEEAVLLQMFHASDHVGRCPRCSQDAYKQGQAKCPVCYGTNFYDDKTQTGGVKTARRVWCIFTDHVVSEQYGQYGVLKPDTRQVQTEAFPALTEHDFIVRVKRWDTSHTVLEAGGYYEVEAVTQNSLRTGNRYGQTWQDVIGQAAQCSWIPPNTMGIHKYLVEGKVFPAATIAGTPVPVAVVEPDTKVVFYPITQQSGQVLGGTATWESVFTFPQDLPSQVWTISHSLGHLPSVTVYVGGEEVDADVDCPNLQTVVITFAEAQAGYAELV